MVKIALLNYIMMSLFIQDKSTLYSDLLQSYDNSMHSSNDYLYFSITFFYLEPIGFVLCEGICITISIISICVYLWARTSKHVCVYVHTRMYIDIHIIFYCVHYVIYSDLHIYLTSCTYYLKYCVIIISILHS